MSSTATTTVLDPLMGSLREYRDPRGIDLLGRTAEFLRWQDLRRCNGYWPYSRSTQAAPLAFCAAQDDSGRPVRGVNFASQDYLSLASHPEIKLAATEAIAEYGVHSAGSAAFLGNTKYSIALEQKIGEFLQMEHVVLFPTGWAAGYGVIKGWCGPTIISSWMVWLTPVYRTGPPPPPATFISTAILMPRRRDAGSVGSAHATAKMPSWS